MPAGLILLAFLFPLINGALGLDLMFPIIFVAVYVMLALGLTSSSGSQDSWTWASWRSTLWVPTWTDGSPPPTSRGELHVSLGVAPGREWQGTAGGDTHLVLDPAHRRGGVRGALGVIIGASTLKLRGDYLAIVTLGFGEIIPRFFLNGDNIFGYNLTNGTIGIKGIDSPGVPFLPESLNTWRQFGTLDLNP